MKFKIINRQRNTHDISFKDSIILIISVFQMSAVFKIPKSIEMPAKNQPKHFERRFTLPAMDVEKPGALQGKSTLYVGPIVDHVFATVIFFH